MMFKSVQFVWERISIICLLTFLAHRAKIMEYARGTSAGGGVHPLPEGVAQCEGILKELRNVKELCNVKAFSAESIRNVATTLP